MNVLIFQDLFFYMEHIILLGIKSNRSLSLLSRLHCFYTCDIKLEKWNWTCGYIYIQLHGHLNGTFTAHIWGVFIGSACTQPMRSYSITSYFNSALQWRQNGCDGVSNHQPHDCLLNRLFGRISKKISKARVTGLCAGNSPVSGEFPAQMASNAEFVPFDDIIMGLVKPPWKIGNRLIITYNIKLITCACHNLC